MIPCARRPRTQALSDLRTKGGARSMRAVRDQSGHPRRMETECKGPRWTRAVKGGLITLSLKEQDRVRCDRRARSEISRPAPNQRPQIRLRTPEKLRKDFVRFQFRLDRITKINLLKRKPPLRVGVLPPCAGKVRCTLKT